MASSKELLKIQYILINNLSLNKLFHVSKNNYNWLQFSPSGRRLPKLPH